MPSIVQWLKVQDILRVQVLILLYEPIPVHEGQYWNQFFYEEYERYNSDAWFHRFNLQYWDDFHSSLHSTADQNGLTGSYANLTQNEVKFNDVNIPALTILNPDGTTYQVSSDVLNRDTHDHDMEILGS